MKKMSIEEAKEIILESSKGTVRVFKFIFL